MPASSSMTARAVVNGSTPRGRLLRVLLLRLSAVPADTEQLALLRAKGSLNAPRCDRAQPRRGGGAFETEPRRAMAFRSQPSKAIQPFLVVIITLADDSNTTDRLDWMQGRGFEGSTNFARGENKSRVRSATFPQHDSAQ
jgi:hypothetical protein